MSDVQIRVLLVDADPAGLVRLREATAHKAGEWDIACATDREEALSLVEHGEFDVLVATFDGDSADIAVLLEGGRVRAPLTTRIGLSRHGDRRSVARALGLVHRHLAMPCNGTALTAAIEEAHAFSERLSTEQVRRVAGRLRSIPTLGTVVPRVLAELDSPSASSVRLADIIAEDPSLTAQLLRLVNSPVFSLQHEVTSVFTAVTLLGFHSVGALCLGGRLVGSVEPRALRRAGLSTLSAHSLRTAHLARSLVLEIRGDEGEAGTAFAAGILHDVGKLVLATEFGERLACITTAEVPPDRRGTEQALCGVTHDRLGAYLLGLWGVPLPIVEAVAFHHDPQARPSSGLTALGAVHVANALDHAAPGASHEYPWPAPGVDADYLDVIGLPMSSPVWTGIIRDLVTDQRADALRRRWPGRRTWGPG